MPLYCTALKAAAVITETYIDYYQRSRTHLSLDKDCAKPRPIQPPTRGTVIAIAKVSGLHHRYQCLAARLFALSIDCRCSN
jgi:hypothetical protein